MAKTTSQILLFVLLINGALAMAQELPKGFKRNPIGKGMVLASTTFNVNHKQSEQEQTLLQFLEDSYRVDWEVTLRSGYYIKDGFCVGGYFLVGQDRDERSYLQDGFLVSDKSYANRFGIAPFIRNYFPKRSLWSKIDQCGLCFSLRDSLHLPSSHEFWLRRPQVKY